MRRLVILLVTHAVAIGIGFVAGVFTLPILTAPPAPDAAMLAERAGAAQYTATLSRDLRGNDLLHWGEGEISVSADEIIHQGRLSPGPDFRLYLVPEFVEHEDEFLPLRDQSVAIGAVKSFSGFVLDVPADVDIEDFTTVLVWCESFGEFITAAQYR